jgi:DNA-binding transcriptional regulator YiaG
MNSCHRSEAKSAIDEAMVALHEIGAIDDQSMRELDDSCLKRVEPSEASEVGGQED